MAKLTIDLREGFDDDEVVVRVADREVFRGRVSTRMQLGLAHRVETDVVGPATVTVALGGATRSLEVDPEATPFVGADAGGGDLALRPQGEPFRYM
ncbi:MAG TPA: hypothetical protein RMH99_07960 [Sandaracinaceae bacterium LLY-WYZ-13_1]|nr:hypothetical protein [Sandaracinaceae bacterium LLY-WYZ-13_1]